MSVLWLKSGYKVKYRLSPREILWAQTTFQRTVHQSSLLNTDTVTGSFFKHFNLHILYLYTSVWRIFVLVFLFANISPNIHIHIHPFLSTQIYLYLYLPFFINLNIFVLVFVSDMETKYISICISLHKFNKIPWIAYYCPYMHNFSDFYSFNIQ